MLLGILLPAFMVQAEQCELSKQSLPLYELEQKISTRKLTNGLIVRSLDLTDNNTISIASQFSVGSRNELQGQTGYAHLFEHLLFEGSEHAPGDVFEQKMDEIGARKNASTHFDWTNYYSQFPSYALELILFLDADRFISPSLTTDTINIQKQAVLQERVMRLESQPYFEPAMDFLLGKIKDTPYGHSVIGSRKDIKNATRAQLIAFHQKFYRPDNMQLSIVGKLPKQTRKWVDKYFGDWKKPNSLLESEVEFDINLEQIKGELVDPKGPWPASLLLWNTVGYNHPDAAAVRLLQAHLFSDKASLFSINNQYDPDFMIYFPLAQALASHGVAGLVISPRARASLDELVTEILQLTESVKRNGMSQQRLCYLKQLELNRMVGNITDDLFLAKRLSATSRLDFQHPITAPWERTNVVTVADIQRVANKYFQPNHQIRLDLLPPWYIRWAKQLLEWLPKGTADSIEEEAL